MNEHNTTNISLWGWRTSQPRHRMIRRSLVIITVTLLSTMMTVGLASPAHAWTDRADVDLVGFASCKTVPYAVDALAVATWVYVQSTGETTQQRVNRVAYWEAHLKTIPPEGSWASVWIYCAVPGTTPNWQFSRDLFVSRPVMGTASTPHWMRA